MKQELEDNWNSIVLSIATRGGYMIEKASKRLLCVPEMAINDLTDRPVTKFKQFEVSSKEYKTILSEVQTLREEMFLGEEEQRIKKEEQARKRSERAKKKRTEAKSTAVTKK